ncbi:hypothetical protein AgCh_035079 [Apium graveolens]
MYSKANVLTVVGCDDFANIYNSPAGYLPKGCTTTCQNISEVNENECSGSGCCQVSINIEKFYNLYLHSYYDHANVSSFSSCGYAFFGEKSRFKFKGISDLIDLGFLDKTTASVPIVLDWVIGNKSCSEVNQDSDSFACKDSNSYCINGTQSVGYRCNCKDGYEGNPYFSAGCIEGGATESTKHFTYEELKNATNNYSSDRILGQGGYGIVYKGILPDQRVVAIKKSKVMDQSQVEQFINEVRILTQVIHRNVVKLLGCCLECEVPLLVYEFVPNAVAIPIIHRDVKLANILLDYNNVAKISDFGASRLIPMDQTEVTTLVQGTLGYLDPQYFHTGQLTEKSDVYSFGVVLAELLTGRQPICMANPQEERNLATYFSTSLKENRLFQIIEPRLVKEGTFDQLQKAAQLVKRCLSLNGDDRPTMKEVTMEIESLRKFTKHPWANENNNEHTTSLISHTELQHSDLYEIQLSSYHNVATDSEKYSSSTISLLHPPTSPR